MATFSERYGYTKPSNIIIRERITEEIQNAICNCLEQLNSDLRENHSGYSYSFSSDPYALMEEYVWMYFLNKKQSDFWGYESRKIVISLYLEEENTWYKKLDLLEFIIDYLHNKYPRSNTPFFFVRNLNNEFKRLNFAYRIIEDKGC